MSSPVQSTIFSVLTRILFFLRRGWIFFFSADFRQKVFLWIFLHYSVWYLCLWCWSNFGVNLQVLQFDNMHQAHNLLPKCSVLASKIRASAVSAAFRPVLPSRKLTYQKLCIFERHALVWPWLKILIVCSSLWLVVYRARNSFAQNVQKRKQEKKRENEKCDTDLACGFVRHS